MTGWVNFSASERFKYSAIRLMLMRAVVKPTVLSVDAELRKTALDFFSAKV
jgi:hypothetical protein